MSAAWTSFKLGLFTLLIIAAMAVTALALGIRPGPEKTARYRTYFDESVAGLDVGAQVKYRGITIGAVDAIRVGPDGRWVEVVMKVDAKKASLLDWRRGGDSGLRAKVTAPGLTGVKLVDLEYVDPAAHPPPRLPFRTPDDYLPSAPSFGLQESLAATTEALVGTLHRVDGILANIDAEEVPEKVAAALASVDHAASELRTTVGRVNRGRIPDQVADVIAHLDTTIGSVQHVLARVQVDGGVLSGAEHATDSIDTLGRRATGVTGELDRTLRDLGDAARSLSSFADALERDPDMLLKGRQKGKR